MADYFHNIPEQEWYLAQVDYARWVRGFGIYTIASYDYTGTDGTKAPRLVGVDRGLAIPDLDLCRSGVRFWAEVKWKSHADYHRKTGIWNHGINEKLYRNYLDVEQESGAPVVMAIVEANTGTLLQQWLRNLTIREDVWAGTKMVYFDRAEFCEFTDWHDSL